jgi:hypothetical protein
METLKSNDRVVSRANPKFAGTVVEAADDGKSGYVKFDAEDDGRTFFHASELDPETKEAPAPPPAAAKAESAPPPKPAPFPKPKR